MEKRKKRLCFLLMSHFSAVHGGAQYQARILLESFVKRDEYEIYYVARNIDPGFEPVGYEIVKVPASRYLKRMGFVADYPALMKVLGGISPDIIYQRGFTAYTGIAAHYARKNKARMVLHIASDLDVMTVPELWRLPGYNVPFIDKKIGSHGIRHASAIVTQTRRQKTLLKRNFGREADAVIRNFHPRPLESLEKPLPLKVLWVANFKRVKRPELFVRLARELGHMSDVEFVMAGRAGDARLYGDLHREIEQLGNLRYLGEKTQDEVNRLMAAAHIFVNTSLLEGFPNTFIQAWMRCVPVVSLGIDTDGILEEGKIGFCGKTFEEMKSRVAQLLENERQRVGMGEAARRHALNEHDLSNVNQLMAVIEGRGA